MKKIIAILLLLYTCFVIFVGCDTDYITKWEEYPVINGIDYTYDEATKTLTVTGTGQMKYNGKNRPPWFFETDAEHLIISDGITNISPYAFSCKFRNYEEEGVYNDSEEYVYFTKLKTVKLPDSIRKIGTNAFSYCASLEKINIPDSVTQIGGDAFRYCESLKKINIPDSVTQIGEYAFYGTGVTKFDVPDSVVELGSSAFGTAKEIVLSAGLKEIPDYCCHWDDIKKVTIKEGTEKIGQEAFYSCSELEEVKMPDTVTILGIECFSGCSSLESIKLSDNLEKITEGAFSYCEELKTIDIPDKVEYIPVKGFYNCTALESVTLPESLKSIRENAFEGCESLVEVKLPEGLEKIEKDAFCKCYSLKEITIPESVTFIGGHAFGYDYEVYGDDYEDYREYKRIKDFTIKGYKGTVAEKWAKKYKLKFIALD